MLVSCFPVGLSTAQGLFCMAELHSQNDFSLGPLCKATLGPPAGCVVPFPLAVRASSALDSHPGGSRSCLCALGP